MGTPAQQEDEDYQGGTSGHDEEGKWQSAGIGGNAEDWFYQGEEEGADEGIHG